MQMSAEIDLSAEAHRQSAQVSQRRRRRRRSSLSFRRNIYLAAKRTGKRQSGQIRTNERNEFYMKMSQFVSLATSRSERATTLPNERASLTRDLSYNIWLMNLVDVDDDDDDDDYEDDVSDDEDYGTARKGR